MMTVLTLVKEATSAFGFVRVMVPVKSDVVVWFSSFDSWQFIATWNETDGFVSTWKQNFHFGREKCSIFCIFNFGREKKSF